MEVRLLAEEAMKDGQRHEKLRQTWPLVVFFLEFIRMKGKSQPKWFPIPYTLA